MFKQKTIGLGDAPACGTCHSTIPDEVIVGPSLFGVTNRAETTIQSPDYHGEATTVSEYLMESIKSPNAFVREGFTPGVMYQGFAEELSDEQILDLVAFLETLK
jgi:cytochrome c2